VNNKIVLISCVSKKLSYPAKTKDIYISTLFKLHLKYAERIEADEIYVLSAKYGLLELEQVIEPYNVTLNNMCVRDIKDWAACVIARIDDKCDIEYDTFVFLAGVRYRKYLLPRIKHYEIPLKRLRIGEQLRKLKELTS
jgi:hypothetical protein